MRHIINHLNNNFDLYMNNSSYYLYKVDDNWKVLFCKITESGYFVSLNKYKEIFDLKIYPFCMIYSSIEGNYNKVFSYINVDEEDIFPILHISYKIKNLDKTLKIMLCEENDVKKFIKFYEDLIKEV